ncbi:MAG: hypothetical protein E7058_00060 [Lentisphaerae bacterium]|nr:hypothetical protein [Lentisphaerota bacterium]
MKKILIMLNLILAGIVGISVLSNLTLKVKKENESGAKVKKVQKNTTAKRKKNSAEKVEAVDGNTSVLKTPDEAWSVIVEQDVFNQIRSPLANMRVGQGDMTLVGVVAGKAAIVKNNARNRQFNPYLAQAQRMAGSMSGRPAMGRFTQWSQMSGRNSGPAQQYIRLGESTSSGYTLAEVTRSRAVFVRGNDKLELELQDPSKNRAAARRSGQRLNATQQFQQAQMFMQSQMIRTMREIQRNSNSNRAPQGNRNRR